MNFSFNKKLIILLIFSLTFCLKANTANIFTPEKISEVFLPVKYPAEEIANSLNRIHRIERNDVIFLDDSFTNNNNDNIKIKSVQTEDIAITIDDGVVKTTVPVLTEAVFLFKKDINIDLFFFKKTIPISLERKLDFKMIVNFETTVEQDENLKVIPQTNWRFEWESVPYISFVFFTISVLDQVEPIINNVLKRYAENKINKTLVQRINLLKIISDINQTISDAISLNDEYGVFGYTDLKKVKVSPFTLDDGAIRLNLILQLYPYISFSKQTLEPIQNQKRKLIIEKLDAKRKFSAGQEFTLNPAVLITPRDWQNIIFNQISEENFLIGSDNLEMKITEIYSKKNLNTFQFDVFLRSIKSSSVLQRLLVIINTSFYFNQLNSWIELVNFTYSVDTKSVVISLANYFNQKSLEKIIKDRVEKEFNEYVISIENLLLNDLKKITISEKSILTLDLKTIDIQDLNTINDTLIFYFSVKGSSSLDLLNLF